jgi:hypothetical protein
MDRLSQLLKKEYQEFLRFDIDEDKALYGSLKPEAVKVLQSLLPEVRRRDSYFPRATGLRNLSIPRERGFFVALPRTGDQNTNVRSKRRKAPKPTLNSVMQEAQRTKAETQRLCAETRAILDRLERGGGFEERKPEP